MTRNKKWRLIVHLFSILVINIFIGSELHAQCAAAIPYPINDPCVQIVIADDPFCCNNTWDGICQNAYDDCSGGGGCAAVAPYPPNDPCYIEVIIDDPFCCDTNWDGSCQAAYDMCNGGGGTPIVVSSSTFTVPELITDVLLGSCVEASNITSTGAAGAFGNFSGGSDIGFSEGIILCTGAAVDAPGPENGIVTTIHNTPGDPDLDALSGVTTNDAAIIEFEFVSPSDAVTFEYIFASHEYDGYTCSTVNDAFGFFITGPGYAPNTNVALVPGTTTPVSINTVNQGFASGFDDTECTNLDPNYADYNIYFNQNLGSATTEEIAYNGFTDVFTVELDLEPCETYTIKMAIADGGDSAFDSAVFLKAGSFTSGLEVEVVPGTSTPSVDALEGCEDGYFMFINQGPEITVPTDFEFIVGGSATPGDDYTAIDNTVTFQPGQDTVVVNIEAFLDGVAEGTEDIVLTFPDACTCDAAPEAVLNILDNEELTADISDDVTICNGSTTALEVTNASGSASEPYTYLWSTGEETAAIDVSPAATTSYDVTVTDACGGQTVDLEVTVTVANEIVVDQEGLICAGGDYELPDGSFTSDPGLYTFDFLTDQGCDSIVNVDLTVIDIPDTDVEADICEGEEYELPDGTLVTDAGSYPVTLQSVDGCDSLVTTELSVWPNSETDQEVAICDNETYTLPDGTDVDVAGAYTVNLQSDNGCDSIINFELEVFPTYSQVMGASVCGDGGYILPDGSQVFDSGDYEVILTTVNGCDSAITVELDVQELVTINSEPGICDNETFTLPNGIAVDAPDLYEVMVGSDGCDTLYQVDLSVSPTYSFLIEDSICEGETYGLPNGAPVTESGEYEIEYQSSGGCDSVYQVALTVLPNPVAAMRAVPEVASVFDGPVQFFNESTDSTEVEWDFEGFGSFEVDNPQINYSGRPGLYPACLYVVDAFGCDDQYCFEYEVREDFAVFVPNAFTPNEDGVNDLFFVKGKDIDPNDFLLQIFNRYGELVFESNDPTEKWDGGELPNEFYAESEVFTYRLVVGSLATEERREINGKVTVVR